MQTVATAVRRTTTSRLSMLRLLPRSHRRHSGCILQQGLRRGDRRRTLPSGMPKKVCRFPIPDAPPFPFNQNGPADRYRHPEGPIAEIAEKIAVRAHCYYLPSAGSPLYHFQSLTIEEICVQGGTVVLMCIFWYAVWRAISSADWRRIGVVCDNAVS
jgi:hypothetical protein